MPSRTRKTTTSRPAQSAGVKGMAQDFIAGLKYQVMAYLPRLKSPLFWIFQMPDVVLDWMAKRPRKRIAGRYVNAACNLICARAGDNPLGTEASNPDAVRQEILENPMNLSINPPREVESEDHAMTTSDQVRITIREYRLPGRRSDEAMLYIHGGGFVLCNLDTHDAFCRYMAAKLGIRVFSVDYRLAPENPFPTPLQDCLEAWQWMMSSQGCKPSKTLVAGDSAGGNLATAMCIYMRDSDEPLPGMQLLIYPAVDPSMSSPSIQKFGKGFFLTQESMVWFWNSYLPDEELREDPLGAPISAPLQGLPKAQIIVAGFDPLMDEGREYAKRLRSAKVDCSFQQYPELIHGFINMMLIPSAQKAVDHFLERTAKMLP